MSTGKIQTSGLAVTDKSGVFKPWNFEHRALKTDLVHIEIELCGVCHSDIHMCRGEWFGNMTVYPMVPGHEIVGKVKAVGPDVKKFKVGDSVGVGCFVDSCMQCGMCKKGDEQLCDKSVVCTYGGVHTFDDMSFTYGGYARDIVVRESFVLRMPKELEGKQGAAPLLCAGITMYSPMKLHKMDTPGKKIGVVGLGGLGHMAVKFGVAFGNEVTVFSTSSQKEALAKQLGAKNFVISTNAEQMAKAANTLDFILDTVSTKRELKPYLECLKTDGIHVVCGLPVAGEPITVESFPLVTGRRTITGSIVGGLPQTQEMLEFCARKGILCDVEPADMKDVKAIHDRVVKSDVKFRFVFDLRKSCPSREEVEQLPGDMKVPAMKGA